MNVYSMIVFQVVAWGAICGPTTYFKDGWNIMDGTLVIISLLNILIDLVASGEFDDHFQFLLLLFIPVETNPNTTASPKIFGVIRVLRLLRALRPLRVINRAPGVKLVVQTLISSLKPIG